MKSFMDGLLRNAFDTLLTTLSTAIVDKELHVDRVFKPAFLWYPQRRFSCCAASQLSPGGDGFSPDGEEQGGISAVTAAMPRHGKNAGVSCRSGKCRLKCRRPRAAAGAHGLLPLQAKA